MINDHIHLARTLSGSPEFSPIHTFKVIYPDYQEIPHVILSTKRTSKGKLRWHTIDTVDGPVQLMDFRMTVKCLTDNTYSARQYLAFLEDMNGRQVFYVDIDHANTGSDHTSDIKTMRFQISKVHPMVVDLSYYQVEISLDDDFSVV